MPRVAALLLLVAFMTIKQATLDIVVGGDNPTAYQHSIREASVQEETHQLERQNLLATIKEMKSLTEELRTEIKHLKKSDRYDVEFDAIAPKLPGDCADLRNAGNVDDGMYMIYPFGCGCSQPIQVHCDMNTDGGGHTVLIKKFNTQAIFNQSSSEGNTSSPDMSKYVIDTNDLIKITQALRFNVKVQWTSENGKTCSDDRELKRVLTGSDYEKLEYSGDLENSDVRFLLSLAARKHNMDEECCLPHGEHNVIVSQENEVISAGSEYDGTESNKFLGQTCLSNATELKLMIRPLVCEKTYKQIDLCNLGFCSDHCY